MHEQAQPPVFHADLEVAYSEVEITLGDPPTFAFVRSPFNFTRPMSLDELRGLAEGQFGADLDAQLRACTLPPATPLSDGDRARIVRLADEAWSAATAVGDAPTAAAEVPEPTPVPEPPADTIAVAGATIAAPGDLPVAATSPAPRRALKVLLTLQPDGTDDYRALVGVGADGCDPHFGATGAPLPLAAALAAVPAIVAAAEARWLTAPRYPTAKPAGSAATTKGMTPPKAGAGKATKPGAEGAGTASVGTSVVPQTPPTPAKPAAKNQISLFG